MATNYTIETVTLTNNRSGYKSTGPAGLVYTRTGITEFISDFKNHLHNQPFLLLSVDLTGDFIRWKSRYGTDHKSRVEKSGGMLFHGIASGNPFKIAASGLSTIVHGTNYLLSNTDNEIQYDFLLLDENSKIYYNGYFNKRVGFFLRR